MQNNMAPTKEQQAQEYAEKVNYPCPDYGWYESDDEQMKECLKQVWLDGYTAYEQSSWRSVEDELPLVGQEVLCLMKSNSAVVSGFIERNKRTGKLQVATSPDFHFEDYCDYVPTHWMPIPSLSDTNTEKE